MQKNSKIYIAGHRGLVGSAIIRKLKAEGCNNLVMRTSKELDLRRQADVETFFEKEIPEYVFFSAAKVGGIQANIINPATFFYDNILMQSNVIHAAYKYKTKRLLFLSSSCSYPRLCPQPMKEEYLLDGKPEPTNESYAIAKIAGMKMIEAYKKQYNVSFFSIIFPNIYGPGDNFNPKSSHVIPALIRKIYEAKINEQRVVEVLGTGNARREFLFVDDVADACIYFMDKLKGGEIINAGDGKDISIKELAYLIKEIIGYGNDLRFNTDKLDGMPQKMLDVSHMNEYAWAPKIPLKNGLIATFDWFVGNYKDIAAKENDKN